MRNTVRQVLQRAFFPFRAEGPVLVRPHAGQRMVIGIGSIHFEMRGGAFDIDRRFLPNSYHNPWFPPFASTCCEFFSSSPAPAELHGTIVVVRPRFCELPISPAPWDHDHEYEPSVGDAITIERLGTATASTSQALPMLSPSKALLSANTSQALPIVFQSR